MEHHRVEQQVLSEQLALAFDVLVESPPDRREMEDQFRLPQSCDPCALLEQITLNIFYGIRIMRRPCPPADHAHSRAGSQQRIHQMRCEKATAPGHQNFAVSVKVHFLRWRCQSDDLW
jgi:hypothetical protein